MYRLINFNLGSFAFGFRSFSMTYKHNFTAGLAGAVFAASFFSSVHTTHAQEPLEGYFIAQSPCEAYQSKNRLTNPGNIKIEVDRAYTMIGVNKTGGDFFQVVIPESPVTDRRWVRAVCGVHVVEADTNPPQGPLPTDLVQPTQGGESTENLLALSWQPAFCETRPAKIECEALNGGMLPVSTRQLSIHGLWPQPRGNDYCGVDASVEALDKSRAWERLPAPELSTETADELAVAMPGVASFLHHHEWIKHGTCYRGAGGADEYYADTLHLTNAINTSAVVELLSSRVGQEVTGEEIRSAFDEAFGPGTGKSVHIKCTTDGSRVILTELWINLTGVITPDKDLGTLMSTAPEARRGCSRVLIDSAGLQ